jgi:3-dehydroquinate synthase
MEEHTFYIENTIFKPNLSYENEIQIQSYNKKYTVNYVDIPLHDILCKIYKNGDFILVDENIHKLYSYIVPNNDRHHVFFASEETKTMKSVLEIVDKLIALQFSKKNKLIVIGGGITQDVGGFVASIYKRGIEWVLIPTTLLSMADSAIGGKVCINRTHKNIISVFNAPNEIYISDNFLITLQEADVISGIGEALKLALIGGEICYNLFMDSWEERIFPCFANETPLGYATQTLDVANTKLLVNDDGYTNKKYSNIIKLSSCIKRAIIEYDELEKYERKILNYGHTFGHALESTTNYFIPHGIAVLYGMFMINQIFYQQYESKCGKHQDINAFIMNIIPEKYKKINISYDKFIQSVLSDKKNNGDKICFILLEELGKTKMVYHMLTDTMYNSKSLEHNIKTTLHDLFVVNT